MLKYPLLLPFLILGILVPFTPELDLFVSHFFFRDGSFYDNAFFRFLFRYGEQFGFFVSGICCLLFFLTFLKKKTIFLRKPALAMILTFVLGAGVLTNSLLKEYWGRPRPKQIEEFGGHHVYRPFWKPNFHTKHDPQKSFPSGHVAMGFYFLSLVFSGRRLKKKSLFYLGCFLSVFLGIGLMVARVSQGGHFVSDVIASALIMWGVSFTIDKMLFQWDLDDKLLTWVGLEKLSHGSILRDISPRPDDVSVASR